MLARLRRNTRAAGGSLMAYADGLHAMYALLADEGGRQFALRRIVAGGATAQTTEIAAAQYVDGRCHRMDLFVRLLAIEEHSGHNEYGVDLYRRFIAAKSAAQRHAEPSHSPEGLVALLEAVRRRGLASDAPVVIHPGKVLRHGMHRLACAVFLDIDRMPVAVDARRLPRPDYTLERLRGLGLSDDDLRAVVEAERRYAPRWAAARSR
jgi:hypothetical protein